MSDALNVFDRRAVRRHRDRAAGGFAAHDFLVREAGERLADRLLDVRRVFPTALDLGCHTGLLGRLLAGRGGIETLVQADLSPGMLTMAEGLRLVADEEALPFAGGSFDLVLSVLSLHWVNDLPGTLLQVNRCLKPDGLFLGCMLGGETLFELRRVLLQAEAEVEGGAGPRVSPFADARDAGALLQRAGFALPVVDSDRLHVTYPDALALFRELRGMGESNAVWERRRSVSRRQTLARAAALYQSEFAGADGRITATFEILTLTGWRADASQPKPLRPGSGQQRLADVLGAEETPAGDKARP